MRPLSLGIDGHAADKALTVLSRDSQVAQQIAISLRVQGGDSGVNSMVESVGIGECVVGQMMGFKVVPDHLDVVELGRILGQPLDDEPMSAGGEGRERRPAEVDRSIVEDDDDGLGAPAEFWAVEAVEPLEERDEIGASLRAP